jgi:4-amino-4-deoxy-L-arabinose transferase-like glycosyltransferase
VDRISLVRPAGSGRGGWAAARGGKADRWFFVTWAGFTFLGFSASHSKLAPYILPIFPALAVLVGATLAPALDAPGAARQLRTGLRTFAFLCGLLAVAVVVIMARPALVKMDPEQALALQPPAFLMAVVLMLGGILAPWLARRRGARAALGALVATMALFYLSLQWAAPSIQKPGTRELALYVKTHASPGDRVVHYHDFFHDFTFYAGRTVDVVEGKGELEEEEDAAAQTSGRFMDEADFRRVWAQPGRVYAVARKRDVAPLFTDPAFHYHLLAETPDHYLFSNQP